VGHGNLMPPQRISRPIQGRTAGGAAAGGGLSGGATGGGPGGLFVAPAAGFGARGADGAEAAGAAEPEAAGCAVGGAPIVPQSQGPKPAPLGKQDWPPSHAPGPMQA
jgi:hypothetical protein